MSNDVQSNWNLYDDYLNSRRESNKKDSIRLAQRSYQELIANNPGYQTDATRNGVNQPMLVTRENNTCIVTIAPEEELFVGDIVNCYNENWLVMEMYTDEYGLSTGNMWLCNHLFKFQNNNSTIVECYGVIDDGSYQSNTTKALTTTDADYSFYLPLNDDTKSIYIDKRFAISTMYNSKGNEILQVMKVIWIDKINQNNGTGSHLLKLRVTADVYNPDTDSLDNMVCDYIQLQEPEGEPEEDTTNSSVPTAVQLSINGKDSIRIGTSRTYTVVASDDSTLDESDIHWTLSGSLLCSLSENGASCILTVPLNDSIVGTILTLSAEDSSGNYSSCDKVIEVISIG